jgi:hypothetical protein
MQSSPINRGMPRRVAAAYAIARGTSAGEVCRIEPTICSVTNDSISPPSRASSCNIWPTFSGNVIRASNSSTRSSIERDGTLGTAFSFIPGTVSG